MTRDDSSFDLSRRRALAALGTVGAASVGAGLGTSAWFSDTETFENNSLTAGSLDLKVDWIEHYNGDVVEQVPDGEIRSRAVIAADRNTTVENPAVEAAFRNQFADVPNDLDGPVIELEDVKPGDRGALTFSLHLFDNPGYVWLNGELIEATENGVNEPEAADPDEDQVAGEGDPALKPGANGDGKTVELLDTIQAWAWYDDGDNERALTEPLIAGPGSLREVLAELATDHGLRLDDSQFDHANADVSIADATTNSIDVPDESAYTCREAPGNPTPCAGTPFQLGFRFDREDLPNDDQWTELTPADERFPDDLEYTISVEVRVTERKDGDEPVKFQWRNLQIKESGGDFVEAGAGQVTVKGGNAANVCTPVTGPASGAGDQEFHPPHNDNQSIAEISHFDFCIAIIGDDGGNGGNGDDGGNGDGENGDTGDECLENSTTRYVGFEWWLPIDHGNEVQTDSLAFDLGFYTEQCRHNDGSGMSQE
mgnify:CR=1 FL=1